LKRAERNSSRKEKGSGNHNPIRGEGGKNRGTRRKKKKKTGAVHGEVVPGKKKKGTSPQLKGRGSLNKARKKVKNV